MTGTTKRLLLASVLLTAVGFVACSEDEGDGGSTGTGGTGSGGNATVGGATGAKGGATATAKGGATAVGNGGATTAAGGGSAKGGATSTGALGGATSTSTSTSLCGTTDSTKSETITFAQAGVTTPYKPNSWSTATKAALTQTTTGVTGIDCSGGCALLSVTFAAGDGQWAGAQIVQYFGATETDVENLLNTTVSTDLAVVVQPIGTATVTPALNFTLTGYNTAATNSQWNSTIGTATALSAATGFHTYSKKIVNTMVPEWQTDVTKQSMVCASGLHSLGIQVNTGDAITAANAVTVSIYVKNIKITPASGSGGTGGTTGAGGATSTSTTTSAGGTTSTTTGTSAGGTTSTTTGTSTGGTTSTTTATSAGGTTSTTTATSAGGTTSTTTATSVGGTTTSSST